ncbi:thymidylate synthase [candidate division WWE3 bacterium]|uniref:Thymidylate synthase n=1 Tax=candidate division WWE3 bacterium TaxID=2053526 RepID=A0A955LGI0_UNCKA|nr:thymidylate synthase [candidate division WWE3 bacterium]
MRNYLNLLQEVINDGHDRMSRNGMIRSLFTRTLTFDFADGFPAVTTKKLFFSGVRAELLWFLAMRDRADVKELQEMGCHIWDANADAAYWIDRGKTQFDGDLGRVYGVQWRSWKSSNGTKIDQLGEIIQRIKKEPYDRRLIVSAWNPGDLDDMALPPCHIFFQFFVQDDKLSLTMYQRSCDLFLGVPFNIASYALLLAMVAQVTDLRPSLLTLVLGDTHIYHDHFEAVNEQLSREPKALPSLWLNPAIKTIDGFSISDIELRNYEYHPTIKAKMSV